ncbi:MAG: hypothetical protein KC561_05550 [Myxococcales bacterium]|nr:hypothetical protein [Myxococcales bacterium]
MDGCQHLNDLVERLKAAGLRCVHSWSPHRNDYVFTLFEDSSPPRDLNLTDPLAVQAGTAGCVPTRGRHVICLCPEGAWMAVVLKEA